jgi:hypothetical protein
VPGLVAFLAHGANVSRDIIFVLCANFQVKLCDALAGRPERYHKPSVVSHSVFTGVFHGICFDVILSPPLAYVHRAGAGHVLVEVV